MSRQSEMNGYTSTKSSCLTLVDLAGQLLSKVSKLSSPQPVTFGLQAEPVVKQQKHQRLLYQGLTPQSDRLS